MMRAENYFTHKFEFSEETYYKESLLVCQKCAIKITQKGHLFNDDLSCDEYIIKNILE